MTTRTIHMQVRERVPNKAESDFRLYVKDGRLALDPRYSKVPTTDAILSAEDPNDPYASVMSGICDPGKIWTGIEDALNTLPVSVRDAVGQRFLSYAKAAGWKVDASGAAVTTDASGRRLTNFEQRQRAATDAIRSLNDTNKAFWDDSTQAHRAPTTDARVDDRRHVARDGAGLAGATRDLVSSLNSRNAEFWAANAEASRAGR